MGTQVRIYDRRALLDAKAALVKFAEQVGAALASMDSDVARLGQWLHQDRPSHWKREIRQREDGVLAAKTDIQRKIIAQAPEPVSLILERKVVQRAQAYTEEAKRRYQKVKQWGPRWERDSLLYKTTVSGLTDAINRDIPLALNRLEKMLLALEAYERIAPPDGGDGTDTGVTSDVIDIPLLPTLAMLAPPASIPASPPDSPDDIKIDYATTSNSPPAALAGSDHSGLPDSPSLQSALRSADTLAADGQGGRA